MDEKISKTTIQIDSQVREYIEKLKLQERETYNSVLRRILIKGVI